VSVVGHLVADRLAAMIEAYLGGDVAAAARLHHGLLPVYTGVFRTQGVITTKAALADLALPGGPVRLPLVDVTEAQRAVLRADLADGGVAGFPAST
jgi:4-hydroxy-tetrahydrodipicolinate synthase